MGGVEEILRDGEHSLAEAIEAALGVAPFLEVVRESITSTPQPSSVAEVLRGAGAVLVRVTRYRVGYQVVSNNVAVVDLGQVAPGIVDDLQSGRTSLREVFDLVGARKFGFTTGMASRQGDLPEPLRLAFPHWAEPVVWRSYLAGHRPRPGFLVFEALPATTWERLLAHGPRRPGEASADGRGAGKSGRLIR
jgi:hypothetical protein